MTQPPCSFLVSTQEQPSVCPQGNFCVTGHGSTVHGGRNIRTMNETWCGHPGEWQGRTRSQGVEQGWAEAGETGRACDGDGFLCGADGRARNNEVVGA